MSQMTSFGSNVMTKDATDTDYLEKYRYLKMEPPVKKLHVPKMKMNYLQSVAESKVAWQHKVQHRYKEQNIVGIRQLNYLNPKY